MAEDKEDFKRIKRRRRPYHEELERKKYNLNQAQTEILFKMIQKKAYFLSLTHPNNSEIDNWLWAEIVILWNYPNMRRYGQ